ncbi:hypothetical protein MIB92_00290 [Aestuariirhabdus sp. Z084]|uniref:hypothetical protein n=1 Tax=Aestuariirhabdus haliotis TaxID=2918751 RepID=UPI00201B42A7|nr:hypothetical protein [Aestuariirhabdus haliotis]MCL6414074.1 hypothetical protein [Aestuariirhabdus haliotis]MCL6418006.1 hypothetical protein [Aestuariirhabdus haliotis]
MEAEEEILVNRYAAGILHTDDILEFVNTKLDAGAWSDVFLEILDYDPKSWVGISELFEKYLKEREVNLPSLEEAVRYLVEHHVKLIASGSVEPCGQFRKMLQEIDGYDYYSKTKDYVGDDLGIHVMYGWYYEDYCSVEEINRGIFNESQVWVSKYSKKH